MCKWYREWKEKYSPVDNEEEDTLTYRYKNTFIFRPDLSGPGLTGNEVITMPHPSTLCFWSVNSASFFIRLNKSQWVSVDLFKKQFFSFQIQSLLRLLCL